MCTVTYIPVGDTFYISSNRDVKYTRMQALPPDEHIMPSGKLIFPRDADAGGTWIAMHENGNVGVLLNGAFEKHISNPPYKKSRGVIFIEVLSADQPINSLELIDLIGVEPFTIIIIDNNNLFESRWDGKRCHCKQLERTQSYIWSSVTLYEKQVVENREKWFAEFRKRKPGPTRNDILHFHRFAGDEDIANNLMMNREGAYSTVSVTNISISKEKGVMKYLDLKTNKEYEVETKFISTTELLAI